MTINLNKENHDNNSSGSKNKKNEINLSKKEEIKKPNLEKSNTTIESKGKGINLNKSNNLSKSETTNSKSESNESYPLNNKELIKSNTENRKKPILLILIITSILGAGLFWIIKKNNKSEITEKPQIIDSISNNVADTTSNKVTNTTTKTSIEEQPKEGTGISSSTIASSPVNIGVIDKGPKNESDDSSTQSISKYDSPSSSIEEKANKVIKGEYGTGAKRKRALGAEYSEIQAKVNEILRSKIE